MVILAAMLLCTSAYGPEVKTVDFKLDPPAISAAKSDRPAGGVGLRDVRPEDDASAPVVRSHVRLAAGFGHDVPLNFAIRQLIPPHVRVAFDDGVDRTALVSWQGGRPWNEVIRTAVKPLGLRVVLSPGIVRISN